MSPFALLKKVDVLPHADEVDSKVEAYEEEWCPGHENRIRPLCLMVQILPRAVR
jgi:hypothetical protein